MRDDIIKERLKVFVDPSPVFVADHEQAVEGSIKVVKA